MIKSIEIDTFAKCLLFRYLNFPKDLASYRSIWLTILFPVRIKFANEQDLLYLDNTYKNVLASHSQFL